MSDSDSLLSRFIGGTISIGWGNLSAMVLGLLGTMVAARRLPAEAFGAFVLLQVVASFLAQVSSFGLELSVARFIASTEDKTYERQLINTALSFRVFTILVVSLVASVIRPTLFAVSGSSLIADLAVFVPLLFLLESSSSLLRSILQGLFLFSRIGLADFVASVLNFLLVLVFVLFLDRGVMGLIYARVIALSVSCAFAYSSIPTRKRLEFHLNIMKQVLAFGIPLQVNDILTFIFRRIDTLVIGAFLGTVDIAYYEIARKIPDYLTRLFEAFRSVYFSFMSKLFARGQRDKAIQVLNNSTRWISFLTAVGALTAVVFGNSIISLLFSDRYLPSAPVFVLLMIRLNIALISNLLGTALVAVGDSNKPAIINVVHTAVALLGNLIFLPIFGIVGAALASLAGPSATNPLNVLFLRRRRVDVKVADYLKPILVFCGYFLLVLFANPTTFLQQASIIVLFVLTCMLLSIFSKEELVGLLGQSKGTLLKPSRNPRSRSSKG